MSTATAEKPKQIAATKNATHGGFVPDADKMATVKTEHAAVLDAGNNALKHAKAAGDALIALDIPHGKTAEVYKAIGITSRTAQHYQQIARNWSKVEKANAETVSAALASIAVRKPSKQRPNTKRTPAQRVLASVADVSEAITFAIEHVAEVGTTSQRAKLQKEVAAAKKLIEQLEKALTNGSVKQAA